LPTVPLYWAATPADARSFLEKTGLIDHQYRLRIGQVREDILLQVVTYLVGIEVAPC